MATSFDRDLDLVLAVVFVVLAAVFVVLLVLVRLEEVLERYR